MTSEYGSLSFDEAIGFFRDKVNVPAGRWADVWQEQHNTAFSVAGATKKELIADFRGMVDDAIANGKSLSWFKANFKQVAAKHGWKFNGSASWRANIIYSTNVRQAYNAGRYAQLQNFEYWRYKHSDSLSPRPHHKAKDGTILPKTSAFWSVWFPQNGWGCKCKVFGESTRSLKRKGLKPSKEPEIKRREWVDKATGESHMVPEGIDPGFDYSPGKVSGSDIVKAQEVAKPKLAERLKPRAVPSAFSTVSSVDIKGLERVTQQVLTQNTDGAFAKFTDFINQKDIKTVIVNSRQMSYGKASRAIHEDIAEYLNINPAQAFSRFTIRRKRKPEGFTNRLFDHVVVKASGSQSLNRVDVKDMLAGVRQIFKDGLNDIQTAAANKRWYAASQATGSMSDDASRFLTWLHEMGHQVHYHAGIPNKPTVDAVTSYAKTNDFEWFAEHFIFYVLANDDMRRLWPDVANWFDDKIEVALR